MFLPPKNLSALNIARSNTGVVAAARSLANDAIRSGSRAPQPGDALLNPLETQLRDLFIRQADVAEAKNAGIFSGPLTREANEVLNSPHLPKSVGGLNSGPQVANLLNFDLDDNGNPVPPYEIVASKIVAGSNNDTADGGKF